MSDSSHTSIHPFSTRSANPHRSARSFNPAPRYGTGIALVVLLHAGALIAFKSGLIVDGIVPELPPFVARVVPPIVEPPPKPIDNPVPTLQGFNIVAPQPKPIETVPETQTPPLTPDTRTSTAGDSEQHARSVEIRAAMVDPRHPLTQPTYPPASRRLGEQGSVELLVFVQPNGRVSEARVANSSGFARLDEAAMREALRGWRFVPNREDGVATASWCRIAITFRLKD